MKRLKQVILTLCAPWALVASRRTSPFAIDNNSRQGERPVTIYHPTAKTVRRLQRAQALLAVLLIALMGLAGTVRPALASVPDENSQIAFTRGGGAT